MNNSSSILWIASGNKQKSKELVYFSEKLLSRLGHVNVRGPQGVDESESTFVGNARLKAHALAQELLNEGHQNFWVLGDDSGLVVDLLDGRPGVYSARYSSPDPNPQKNLDKLLMELGAITTDLGKRTGAYHCALALLQVSEGQIKKEFSSVGIREGFIGLEPMGTNGYAYDSVFVDPETRLSYGEVPYEEKQNDSHRYRAFAQLNRQQMDT